MTKKQIIQHLGTLRKAQSRMNPDQAWIKASRDLLLCQIRNTVEDRSSFLASAPSVDPFFDRFFRFFSRGLRLFVPKKIVLAGRPAFALVLVFAVTVSGWIATVSAANSLPGEPLYQVKLAKEKTELIVASVVGTEEDKVNTLLNHASNRVIEYQKSKNSSQAVEAIQSLKNSIEGASQTLATAKNHSDPAGTAVAKAVNEKTEQLLRSLQQHASPSDMTLSATTSASATPTTFVASATLQKEVGDASHLIAVTGVHAAELLVQKNLAGDQTVDINAVKASVLKKLDTLVTDFSQIKQDAAAVGTIIASSTAKEPNASTVDIVHSPPIGESDTTSSTASTTVVTVGDIKAEVKATEQKVGEADQAAKQTVAEAKTLIRNNDLLGALQKVQELATVKKETANAVIDVQTVTQSMVPAVSASASTSAQGTIDEKTSALHATSSSDGKVHVFHQEENQ